MTGTVIVEVGIFLLGLFLYARTTTAKDKIGSVGLWSLAGFLGIIYAANLTGPPPPDISSIAVVGNAMWLLVAWAYWIDKHRTLRDPASRS
jgi:hypothetical protein